MRSYLVRENDTLRAFTDAHDPQASLCFGALLRAREIRVNGVRVDGDVPLAPGDEVRYYLTPAQEKKLAFTPLYEDGNVLVLDKESGVSSEAVFCALSRGGETHFIHRLDRNTEGLMIFARNAAAEEELLAAFRERRVRKVYLALVVGRMTGRGVEEAYLEKDGAHSLVRVSDRPRGERIVTEYEAVEARGECTLVRVTLHTGKTHQIRAHLAYLGHPVLGDGKYGDFAANKKLHAARQRLLAKELHVEGRGVLAYLAERTFVSPKKL